MFMRKLGVLLAVAATVMALGAASSPASSYWHRGINTGNVLAAGSAISPSWALFSQISINFLGDVNCGSSTFAMTVGASGGATVGGTLDSLTLSSCTDTIPVITISSCHLVTPLPTVTATASGSTGGTVTLNNLYIRCNVSGGTSGCYYNAFIANGTYTNVGAELRYSGVSISHSVPFGGTGDLGSLCGSLGSISMTFEDILTGAFGQTAYLNTTP